MTEDQIKHMVNRFLGWRLPMPWHPDNGISYKPVHSPGFEPTGTNLFDATQADAMVRYMADGLPVSDETRSLKLEVGILSRALRLARLKRRH